MGRNIFASESTLLSPEDSRWGEGLLRHGLESLSLEQKVTAYFEQWRDQVYRYLVAVFGHPELAEEYTQEAFLRLYNALHHGDAIVQTRAWVFRVAHNLALNQIKQRQFLQPLSEEEWEGITNTLRDSSPGPEQRMLQQDKLSRLLRALARLTPSERECLHLRSKGFRYREMAEILNMSTTTVAETLYRVIEKLARELND